MKSRMDRYYNSQTTVSRTSKNKDLYDNYYDGDYSLKKYSNVEGVADIDKKNEIDLSKLQQLLKKRQQEQENEIPKLVKRNIENRQIYIDEEEKNYDIKDALIQARSSYKTDDKPRKLDDTSYDILRKINIKEVEEDNELKKLINTVTTTSLLNKMGDKDLSLNVLDDLKSNDNTSIIKPSEMKTAIKNQNSSYESNNSLKEIDKSFYTSSLGFTDDDFEQLKDIQCSIKTNNKLIKVLVFILIIGIIAGILFLLFNL